MDGISLGWRSIPQVLIEEYRLERRFYLRAPGADREILFWYRDCLPIVPAWLDGQLCVCPWGNPPRGSKLPRAKTVEQETIAAGAWRALEPATVEIPATFAADRDVWYRTRCGLKGAMVRDERGKPIVYLLTQPATHYYQVMTRNTRMPVFLGEQF